MPQNNPHRRPQKLDAQGIRGLVLALAVSATIGFWAIFSRADGISASGTDDQDHSLDGLLGIQEESSAILNLPPIPTLIPTPDPSIVSLPAVMALPISAAAENQSANPTLIAPPPSKNKPARDNSKPEKQKMKREKATTSTRSS